MFTFIPEHFIASKNGVLRQLESARCEKARVNGVEHIPRDREYIVIVPKNVEVSKKFLRDTPNNVVFVIVGGICANCKNIGATKCRKCFYVRTGCVNTFTDDRLPGLELSHVYYDVFGWTGDNLTLVEYFKKVLPKPKLSDRMKEMTYESKWNTLFENAFKEGLEIREKSIEDYLNQSVKDIPKMIACCQKEKVYDIPVCMIDSLNSIGLKNVKWFKRDDCVVLSIVF